MNCPKCGNPLVPNMNFCTKCGTPVSQKPSAPQQPVRPQAPVMPQQPMNKTQQPQPAPQNVVKPQQQKPPVPQSFVTPQITPQNVAAQPQKTPKKKKSNKNLPLIIVAAVLVLAVLASTIAVVPGIIRNKNEINAATEYIEEFPTLKQRTALLVYDINKFPSEKYEIKVERMFMGGILNGVFMGETIIEEESTEHVYDLDFEKDGDYRITLTDKTEPTESTETEVIEIVIIIDVKVDDDAEDAVDRVDLNWVKEDAENNNKKESFVAEDIYAPVLKTYTSAFANNYYSDDENKWDEKNEYDISKVNPEINLSLGGIVNPLSYCYYDISNDGTPELIICIDYGDETGQRVVDMFGYENNEIKRLFSLWTFGARVSYSVYTDGHIRFGSGGAMYSEETYYLLEENSATPKVKTQLSTEYSENETKYYMGPENNCREITESEYNAAESQCGDEVTLDWNRLCESKLYEAEFSVRTENGINSGYQQLYVTNETDYVMTVVYTEVGTNGYSEYVKRGTVFKVTKDGATSNVTWTDGLENEYTGTIAYQDDCFKLTFKTDSSVSAIRECTGATLRYKGSDSTDTPQNVPTPPVTKPPSTASPALNTTPYGMWEAFVTKNWVDEDGNKLKFTQNITYYKLKPNAIHTSYDFYMGSIETTNSKGKYYGHYHIDDDKQLRIQFNNWPEGSVGLLLNERYVWDPTLQKENSWCMTSDGKIKFSTGDNEFSGKTFRH